jgi:hypothetical protein
MLRSALTLVVMCVTLLAQQQSKPVKPAEDMSKMSPEAHASLFQAPSAVDMLHFAPRTEGSGCRRKRAPAVVLPRAESIPGATANRRPKTRSSALRIPMPYAAREAGSASAFAT